MSKLFNGRSKPKAHGKHARHARSRRTLWATVTVVVLLLAGATIAKRLNTSPPVVEALAESDVELLPLGESVEPIRGGHDMALIPEQIPEPREVAEGEVVPQVDIPKAEYDFGMIPADPPVSYVFAIQNTGATPLTVSNLVTSCGCTTAELSAGVIQPGERADLQVVFDPDFHRTVGPVTRVVWAMTDDPTQPWIELKVSADVRPELQP